MKAELPAGGWLVIGDLASTRGPLRDAMAPLYQVRSPEQLGRFLEGLDLAEVSTGIGRETFPAWGALGETGARAVAGQVGWRRMPL